MRILLVSDAYPPLIGGANRSAALLAHGLGARGHVVAVATAWQRGLPTHEDDDGVTVHRLRDFTSRVPWLSADPYVHIPPPFPDPEAVWRLRRLIRRFRPDVVHAYGWLTYSCAAALTGSDIPLLMSARDYGNVCPKRTLIHDGAICSGPAPRKCLACATGFYGAPKGAVATAGVLGGRPLLRRKLAGLHSVSSYVHGVVHRHLTGPEAPGGGVARAIPEEVLPNFHADLGSDRADPTLLARLPETPYILFVGALRLVKGLEPLLAAYQQLTSPPPLVLLGTRAPDTPTLPPNVTVIYGVPHATALAAWDRALFGVAPSIWPEPLGNVVHEAMTHGKAVIGTMPGGMTDMIVDGETGLLVPAGDVEALAAAMRLLVTDKALRERMGQCARTRSRLFTEQAILPRVEALYEQLVRYKGVGGNA